MSGIKWSPDSRYIAQTVYSLDPFLTPIGFNIYDTAVGGPNSRRISPTLDYLNRERINFNYAWSPDSTRIAYRSSHEAAGTTQLYTSRADGSATARINPGLASGRDVVAFAWSPDGSRIAYSANQLSTTRDDLFVSNFDGTNNQRINAGGTRRHGFGIEMRWSPNSDLIAYSLRSRVPVLSN